MIRLFTDSAANLPLGLAEKQGATVLPFTFTLDGEERSPIDPAFDGRVFYRAMREGAAVKTSMVNTAMFVDAFRTALQDGDDVLFIGISGGISGTQQAARIAAEELREEFPDRTIAIVDSLGASLGEGLLVLEAATLIRRGEEMATITERLSRHIRHMCQCFTVDDLRYLRQGGRISGAAAMVGGLLGIRPVLVGDTEGHIVQSAKVRGAKQVLDALAERYDRFVLDRSQIVGIAHADNEDGARYLLGRLHEKGLTGHDLTVCFEPVTGAHVGPGAVALFFFGRDRAELCGG